MTALNLPQPDLLKNRMKDIPSELVLCAPKPNMTLKHILSETLD